MEFLDYEGLKYYTNYLHLQMSNDVHKVTWSELVDLRDGSSLDPGKYYRITDFITTTSQTNTRSAEHQFDIIVLALSNSKISEIAKVTQHEDDTYFLNRKLESWEIKYCLDNARSRFAWASLNGKGVIYYMKDEFGNEAGYDFKNIQFKNLRRFSDSFVSKSNADKIVDVEALDFSNSNWFTSDSVVMQTESNYKYTFSKGTTDASLNSTCRYNIIENTEDASESAIKQYLPFVVLESDTGAIHGNKCLQCPINIYVHVSDALRHNTFDLHCKNVYICGDRLHDSYFSALLRIAFRGYTWDTYIQSCEDWVIWSSSHCKNNHFRGVCQKYKIVCNSMQNVHAFGQTSVFTSLMPSAYLLAITLYPYSGNITFTGSATWVERFTFMGSNKLTLNIDSGKVYSSIFYPGDYTDKAITEFNRTESNADTGVTYEYKPNNSTTIMI